MATGVGMSFDLDAALRNAEKLDKKLADMVENASKLEQTMTNAFRAGGATEILSRLQQRLTEVGKTKVDVHFETKKAEKMYSIMDRIVGTITTLSQGGAVELFDTKKVYETADSMLLVEHRLAETQVQIESLRKKWNELLEQQFNENDFSAPINKRTGKAYGKDSKTYENALNFAKQQFAETQEFNRMLIEERLKVLIETEAIQKKELQWSSMTEDQKAQYVQKRLNEVLKAEQKHTSEVQREYSKLSAEIIRIYDQIQRTEKSVAKGEKTGVDVSKEKGQLTTLENQLREKLARQQQIEQESGNLILQQIEDFWVKVQERDRKGLEDRIKAQQEAKKREEEEWQRYIRTPEGAIGMSESAKSINDEREAIKLLIAARDNLSKSTANYQQIIDDLNNRIQKHRISVEQLTTAEKNEQTLQPTIRNEYARLLKELDQLADAKKRLYMTDAYKSNDADANRALNDIMAREQDVQNKIAEIRKNAQGLLDETERKHAADRANNEIAEIERVERKRQEYAKLYTGLSPMQAQSLVTAGQGTQAIANEERAIQRLVEQKYALDKQDQNYVQTINRLDDEIAEHKRNIQSLTAAESERAEQQKKQNQTFAGAIAFSDSAKTLEEERQAVKNLEAAREKLDKTDVNYQKDLNKLNSRIKQHNENIQEATAGAEDLRKKHRGLMDTSGQLARALAAVFSVSAIKGYVGQMIKVRGEMELQQTALRAILQDKDEADRIWSQTLQLAVKSPYTIRQLTAYTKQLAAYRVETEKLHETTKMLADVSSGLGVDMQRIILAFGQVKAANYLRGTELRQFSEAGINILKELATYYEEIEGRAYSVGEVFDMVSRRAVSFADVEQVFKRITSEGGIFYQMQEKQALTLQGRISNLRDSIDIMLNEMGEKSNSFLGKAIDLIKEWIDNWQEIAHVVTPFLVSLIARLAIVKSGRFLAGIIRDFKIFKGGIKQAVVAFKALNTQMKIMKATNIIGWVALAVGAFFSLKNSFDEVDYSAQKVAQRVAEFKGETEKLTKQLEKLLSTIDDENKSLEERDKAYKTLTRTFSDYLTKQDLERNGIEQLNGQYDEYLEKIKRLRREKEKESVIGWVKEEYENADEFKHAAEEAERFLGISSVDFFTAAQNVQQKITEGAISDMQQAFKEFFKELGVEVDTFYGESIKLYKRIPTSDNKNKDDIIANGFFYTSKEGEELEALQKSLWANNILTRLEPLWSKLIVVGKKYKNVQDEVAIALEALQKDLVTPVSVEQLEKNKKVLDNYYEYLQTAYSKAIPFNTPFVDMLAFEQMGQDKQKLSEAVEEIAEANAKSYQEAVIRTFDSGKYDEKFRTSISNLYKKSDEGDVEYLKRLGEDRKQAVETIKQYEKEQAQKTPIKTITEEEYRKAKFIEDIINRLIGVDNDDKNKKSLERLRKMIELVRQLGANYEEMWNKYGKAYANANIFSQERIDAWKELGLNIFDFKVGDKQDIVDNLAKLFPFAEGIKGGAVELGKAQAEIQVDIDWKEKESENAKLARFIEGLFGDYEITLEMEKFNIPKDLASKLFGFEAIDLDGVRDEILKKSGLATLTEWSNEKIFGSEAYKNLDKDTRKQVEDSLNKITELEQKEYEKRIEKYVKYLEKAQSERLKLKLGELKQLAEIEKTFTMTEQMAKSENIGMNDNQWNAYKKLLTENKEINEERLKQAGFEDDIIKKIIEQNKLLKEQGEIAKEGVSREVREQIAKAEWEAFEKSPEIVSMFSDLDRLSNTALKGLLSQLETLKTRLSSAGLPASELKDILSRIAQIEEEIGDRNPFAGWGGSEEKGDGVFSYFKNRKAFENAQQTLKTKREELNKAEDELVAYQENTSTVEWSVEKYNELSGAVSDATKEVEKSEKAFQDAETKYNRSARAVDQLNTAYHSLKDGLNEVADSAQDMLSNLGVLSEEDGAIFDGIQSAANNALGAAGNIARIAINPADIGAWVGAFSSVMGLISDIAGVGDARKEKQIQKEIKLVEHLGKLYEKLEKQIDAAYSIDTYEKAFQNANDNLEQQIQARQRMINLEEDKKNTDEEAISQYNDEIDDLIEQQKELESQRLQALGGVGGEDYYKDAAEGFVDAWLNAFLETGDGLSALEDEFDEFFKNYISKQMMSKTAGSLLSSFFSEYDKKIQMVESGDMTAEEFAKWYKEQSQYYQQKLDERLKLQAAAYGAENIANSELSGLSAGIQGMSAEQADILAAYWSSSRFLLSTIDNNVRTITENLGINAEVENPMLSQLMLVANHTKTTADNTTVIKEMLEAMTTSAQRMGGRGIKVVMD